MKETGKATPLKQVIATLREAATVLLIVVALQAGLVQAYFVPTGSMESTILAGDFILADKLTLGPRTPDWVGIPWTDTGFSIPALKLPGFRHAEQGDIVVVRTPVNSHVPYVKRVVALAGQTVTIRDKVLYVDGTRFPAPENEQHVDRFTLPPGVSTPGIPASLGNRDNWGPYRVPEGMVFLQLGVHAI